MKIDKLKSNSIHTGGSRRSSSKRSSSRRSSSKKKSKSKQKIVKYKLNLNNGSPNIDFELYKGDSIITYSHTFQYMNKYVEINTQNKDGIFTGIGRWFSGLPYFLNGFKGTSSRHRGKISISSYFGGDLIGITIKRGQKYHISHHSLIVSTDNIKVGTSSRLRGIFGGFGLFVTEASIRDDSDSDEGIIWVNGFGVVNKIILNTDEELSLHSGLFLACDSDQEFSINKIGNYKSFFLSGEGIVMRFKGPAEIYTQSHHPQTLVKHIEIKQYRE